jgi:signal transduction histidine kinase
VIILAVFTARGLARLDISLAGAMLQTSRVEVLAQRVTALAESRADVVDAADAERRRIERDLHDGTQQRLVSLAMNLGMARANLADTDPRARAAIEQAHDEAKQALAELRDLVRGLHPAVLDDRGLDAALSGIAARSPVPVRLRVSVPDRPSRTIEAVAYFVVSEALANVAKHAKADRADVDVSRKGDMLHLAIRDTGRGGADPNAGTGLRGLAQRIGSVDGSLRIDSPAGGPTQIIVELPCES